MIASIVCLSAGSLAHAELFAVEGQQAEGGKLTVTWRISRE
jgi:hypothetical protein